MPDQQPNITSPWTSDDTSENRLELAITDQVVKTNGGKSQPVLAMRDTAHPRQVLYVTQGQLHRFMSSAQQQDSATARLISAGAAAGGGSSR